MCYILKTSSLENGSFLKGNYYKMVGAACKTSSGRQHLTTNSATK
jgi:hypothetical protein